MKIPKHQANHQRGKTNLIVKKLFKYIKLIKCFTCGQIHLHSHLHFILSKTWVTDNSQLEEIFCNERVA